MRNLGNLGETERDLKKVLHEKMLLQPKVGSLESDTKPLLPRGCGIAAVVALHLRAKAIFLRESATPRSRALKSFFLNAPFHCEEQKKN